MTMHAIRRERPLLLSTREPGESVERAVDRISGELDAAPGFLFQSAVTQPGRYLPGGRASSDVGIAVECRGRALRISLLHPEFRQIFDAFVRDLGANPEIARVIPGETAALAAVVRSDRTFSEEQRTQQPSAVKVIRRLANLIATDAPDLAGWYGAFGYDLMLSYDPLRRRLPRGRDYRDLVVYLPRRLITWGHSGPCEVTTFHVEGPRAESVSQHDLRAEYLRERAPAHLAPPDPDPAHYVAGVRAARERFEAGEAFEIVLSQVFGIPGAPNSPGTVYRNLVRDNPAPYHFLLSLGRGESLVGASPEMYVRVRGSTVETCPISGTVKRGKDSIQDFRNIVELLSSEKEAAELTMCTDVDRNDKSRVSVPGTVRVVARRQIELYSRLIHTVDHVKATLATGFDAWDAFMSHMWAATVTGAPKHAAAQFIENTETAARRWYGGSIGYWTLDGAMDTGLTLRAARATGDGYEVRAGATLLIDSDPESEERETRLKASAVMSALTGRPGNPQAANGIRPVPPRGPRTLLIDCEDSFVHTLAAYLREQGCRVTTLRWDRALEVTSMPELVVFSPGPGRPRDFDLTRLVDAAVAAGSTVFGVCLGMQAIVESRGGSLARLPRPVHGRGTPIHRLDIRRGGLLDGLPEVFTAGRYHSLFVRDVPASLAITSADRNGIPMSVESAELGLYAVQFHPESLLSVDGEVGRAVIGNVVRLAQARSRGRSACPQIADAS